MMISWYDEEMIGMQPAMPAVGYTWRTIPLLNKEINSKYKNVALEDAIKSLEDTHQSILKIISSHSNEELFTKRLYKWIGTTSIASYLISSTSSH